MSDNTDKAAVAQQAATTNAEGKVTEGAAQPAETKKVNRRGVSSARGTQRLKFTHQLANNVNGLFMAHLVSVEVTNILIGESTSGMPSFNGLEIPRLVLTFASNEEDPNKRHYQTLSFTAVESNVNTIPGAKDEWKVNAIFDWVKHIMNVFVLKGRELTDAEADALSLNFEDFDEQGDYVPVESEVVIAGWRALFENIENMLNRGNDDKPVYKTKDGKVIALWIKLLRHVKHNKKGWQNVNNGDLSFPTFVGEGCIEVFKQNANPSIRLDAVKEAIIPMNIEKAKAPNMGGGVPAMGSPMMGGMPGMGDSFGSINADAAEDMPF